MLAIAAMVACGPSTAELKTAKTATYSAAPAQLLELAQQAAAETYKIGDVDSANFAFMTQPRFYSPTGDLESAGMGDFVNVQPGSVRVAFIVRITPIDAHTATIDVTPQTFQLVVGSPKPRELAPEDPNVPGWVHGRVDSLAMAIYQRAKQFAVGAPGQTAP